MQIALFDYVLGNVDLYTIPDNVENIEIPSPEDMVILRKEDFYPIWDKCSFVSNTNLRCRMVANLVVAYAGQKLLSQLGVESDDTFALQKIPSILSRWDISELYVNGCKIAVIDPSVVRSIFCVLDSFMLFLFSR